MSSESRGIAETGYWLTDEVHQHDEPLVPLMCELFAGCTVLDMGCGDGWYVQQLRAAKINAHGIDGCPHTRAPFTFRCDLAHPVHFPMDWVLSLEVGEHIPSKHMERFVDNMCSNACVGIVLSWAVPGQQGHGHVNCLPNDAVRAEVHRYGFASDNTMETRMRAAARHWWFKHSLMVFRKN